MSEMCIAPIRIPSTPTACAERADRTAADQAGGAIADHVASLESCIKAGSAAEGAKHVRAIREDLGLSVAEFAAELGVSAMTVGRWQSGAFNPRKTTFERIRELVFGETFNLRRADAGTTYCVEVGVQVSTVEDAVELLMFLKSQADAHKAKPKLVRAILKEMRGV